MENSLEITESDLELMNNDLNVIIKQLKHNLFKDILKIQKNIDERRYEEAQSKLVDTLNNSHYDNFLEENFGRFYPYRHKNFVITMKSLRNNLRERIKNEHKIEYNFANLFNECDYYLERYFSQDK